VLALPVLGERLNAPCTAALALCIGDRSAR
jgi:hypothetical protein